MSRILKGETNMKKYLGLCIKNIILVLLATEMVLSGCGKKQSTEIVDTPSVLTNVYTCNAIVLPEYYSIMHYRGIVDGAYCFQCRYEQTSGEEGTSDFQAQTRDILYYLPVTGGDAHEEIVRQKEIHGGYVPLEDYLIELLPTPDGIITITQEWTEDGVVMAVSVDRNDGTHFGLENVTTVADMSEQDITNADVLCDGDGRVYLTGEKDIWVLHPDLTLAGKIEGQEYLGDLVLSPEGKVYVSVMDYMIESMVLFSIDWRQGKLDAAMGVPVSAHANGYFFGDGCNLYYYNEIGIYQYYAEDEMSEMRMSFLNSNIPSTLEDIDYIDDMHFLIGYEEDDDCEYGIFEKSADVDLSDMTVLNAAGVSISRDLVASIVRFNREYAIEKIRVTLNDYSRFDTSENPDAGSQKLGTDILTAVYHPDLVIGTLEDSGYVAILESGLCTDIGTLMKKDPGFSEKDLFGCVIHFFTIDGKLAALPDEIQFKTLIANEAYTGKRKNWTIDNMLDLHEELPEGVHLMTNLGQDNVSWKLMGTQGYASFIDGDKCSFTGKTFLRYLAFLKTLQPKAPEYVYDKNVNQYEEYQKGTAVAAVKAYNNMLSWYIEQVYFGKNTVRIGYPGVSGERFSQYVCLYSIMESSAKKDAAWQFIRYITKYDADSEDIWRTKIPLTHSEFQALAKKQSGMSVVAYFNGSYSYGENAYLEVSAGAVPGKKIHSSDVDWDEVEEYLDRIGIPVTGTYLPAEVVELIEEEISVYLAGSKSAFDTAEMIENRVKLYLSEKN